MKHLLIALALCAACNKEPEGERERVVLATIQGVPLYVDEFERELKRFRLDEEEGAPSVVADEAQKRALLTDLLERRLVLREAEAHNVVVGTDEIEQALQRLRAGWKESEFDELLHKRDMTAAELKHELRDQLLIRKYFRDHVFSRVAVTDQEIEAYLEKNPALNVVSEQVRARQIVVKTEEEARRILQEIKAGLAAPKTGITFEDAAMKYSLSPEGKNGGDLGFFGHGSMPKVIDEACFALKVGEISAIVPSEYGFHIFKVTERREATPRPIEKVREEAEEVLRREKEHEAQSVKLTELRSKVEIVVKEEQLARIM
jgi:peptidyl-prolyl cis-trans isomerase C